MSDQPKPTTGKEDQDDQDERLRIIIDSGDFSVDGFYSGSEERHHQSFIAIIPLSRYNL